MKLRSYLREDFEMSKLTKKRKDAIQTHVENLSTLGRMELGAFDMKWQENKSDIDEVVWKWVNKAIMCQLAFLMDIDVKSGGAMAVMSDLREGEL